MIFLEERKSRRPLGVSQISISLIRSSRITLGGRIWLCWRLTLQSDEREYFITEVKNSTRTDTIRQGIKETLEYLAFLRVDDEFVFDEASGETYFGNGSNGLLVIQDLKDETVNLEGQSESAITILQASELEDKLQK